MLIVIIFGKKKSVSLEFILKAILKYKINN